MNYKNQPQKIQDWLGSIETPAFVYDLDIIRNNYLEFLKLHQPGRIFYPVKCNSLSQVLRVLFQMGAGFEVNNLNELNKVIEYGVDNCINSSPISPARDIRAMFRAGVRQFCFDSREMVDSLAVNAPGCEALLRIFCSNKGSGFDLSHRLGAREEEEKGLIQYARSRGIQVKGVTFHVGSQCCFPANWKAALARCRNLFELFDLEVLNLGGGWPVRYNSGIPPVRSIARAIGKEIEKYSPRPFIQAEPGRFLVGDAALTVSTVTHTKELEGLSRAIVDASVFSGHIEVLENGDGFFYPIEANSTGKIRKYKVGGSTCAGTDVLHDGINLPALVSDPQNPFLSSRIFLLNTGAYTTEYIGKSNMFNGARAPRTLFLGESHAYQTNHSESGIEWRFHQARPKRNPARLAVQESKEPAFHGGESREP